MITATYSPEDNKIRLYPSERLDAETYAKVKAAGYIWAPKQGLFVAPKWTPAREDLALSLAGEIEPEEMTMAERAQAKIDRLEGLADRRAEQAGAFSRAARDISERFHMGQPILVGHHSERKARKDKERMDAAQRKAIEASESVGYWLYRADGVAAHANYKNDPRTRARRIKTLLSELRDWQRDINNAHKALDLWSKITAPEQIKVFVGNSGMVPYGVYGKLSSGEWTPEEAREFCIQNARKITQSQGRARWIAHILNRLSYERELLGPVARYSGKITPAILQVFVRTHGGEKPTAKQIEPDFFALQCDTPLPAHIGLGDTLEMSGDDWRDLMQSCGYEVPAKKEGPPPILNFKASGGQIQVVNPWRKEAEDLRQIEMTAAEYAKQGDAKGTRLSSCGNFRVRCGIDYSHPGPRYSAPRCAVFITDSKEHTAPESFLDYESHKEAAE